MAIGARLKQLRKEAGYTQQQMADVCYVDYRTIGRLEQAGETSNSPHLDRIIRILRADPCWVRYGKRSK